MDEPHDAVGRLPVGMSAGVGKYGCRRWGVCERMAVSFQYLEVWTLKGLVRAHEAPIAFHRQGHE